MMGPAFTSTPIRPDLRRHPSDAMRYVRFEYGEDNPTWLFEELDGKPLEDPVSRRTRPRDLFVSLRALATKIAAVLF